MKYRQRINCVELTKLLEREIVDTLCFTYTLGHTYMGLATGYLANPAIYGDGELTTQATMSGANRYKTRIAAEKDLDIVSLKMILRVASVQIILPLEVFVYINGSLEYRRLCFYYNDDLKETPYEDGTVIFTIPSSKFNESDEIVIRYETYRPYNTVTYRATYEPIIVVEDIPNAPRKTVTEVINRVLDVGLGRKKNEPIKYKLDPVLA